MFERFVKDTRRALVIAQEVARELGHPEISTGHLVAGLARCNDEVIADLLAQHGLTPPAIWDRLAETEAEGGGESPGAGNMPFSAEAKLALEHSLREALRAGASKIVPGFVLLAILRDDDSVGWQIMSAAGVDEAEVRAAVEEQLDAEDDPGRRARRARRAGRRGSRAAAESLGWSRWPLPQTRGGKAVFSELRNRAMSGRVLDTVDYLDALTAVEDGRAAKVLAELGVTAERVREVAATVPAEGTADEQAKPKRTTPIKVDLGGGLEVRITDPAAVQEVRAAAAATDDESALAEIIRDVVRRHLAGEPEPA